MTIEPTPPSRERLDAQLAALKATQKTLAPSSPSREAGRAAIDFTSACAVGVVLGYEIDRWQGTSPWGIVIGLFLGCAAGVKLMIEGEAKARRREEKQRTHINKDAA